VLTTQFICLCPISSSMASVSSVTFSSNSDIAPSLSSDSLDYPEIDRRMSVLDQSTNRPR
jgi:hypothetical protein